MDIKQWEERKAAVPTRFERKNFTTTHYYKNGELLATLYPNGDIAMLGIQKIDNYNMAQIDEEFLNSFTKVKEEIFDELAFVHARTLAQSKRQSFDSEFKAAVFKELNIDPQHPKASKLWEKAMENRCGEGLQALYDEVSDLSELLS